MNDFAYRLKKYINSNDWFLNLFIRKEFDEILKEVKLNRRIKSAKDGVRR